MDKQVRFIIRFPGRNSAPLLAVAVACLLLSWPGPAMAAHYHDLEKNRQPCSDCHTLHYSEAGGRPAGTEEGGPFPSLNIRATTNTLCLFCHDGSGDPSAPVIQADATGNLTWYQGTGDEHSGAGFFANSGSTPGHDLGVPIVVPASTLGTMTLTCASCHDPHGTANYRKILTTPAGGDGVTVEMATDVFRDLPLGDPPNETASKNAYKESNLGYKSNTSKWCVECHDTLKPLVGGTSRGGLNHHLADFPINGLVGGELKTVPDHWLQGYTGGDPDDVGFDLGTGDTDEGVPRLRFQVPGATDFATSQGSEANKAADNQVMCATCHLTHGGKYAKGLVWPYLEGGADQSSGCAQCHKYGQP